MAAPVGGVYKPPVVTQVVDYDMIGYELPTGKNGNNNWKFQNQERISDFDLDVDWFKFRPSDSKIGRFWQIDPLAYKYVYNSPYALQENKFGLGFELEGAEVAPFEMHHAQQIINRNKANMSPEEARRYESRGRAVGALSIGGALAFGAVVAVAPSVLLWAASNPVAATEAGGALLGTAAGAMGYDGNDIVPGTSSDDAGLRAGQAARTIDNLELAKAGEDLFIGTYSKVRAGNIKSGLNSTHTPHHVVQDAISPTSHGTGVTINLRKDLHELTATYKRPVRNVSHLMNKNNNTNALRVHLSQDVRELRVMLRDASYSQPRVNLQLTELVKQNKANGGYSK